VKDATDFFFKVEYHQRPIAVQSCSLWLGWVCVCIVLEIR
jgi:hypothetical protein